MRVRLLLSGLAAFALSQAVVYNHARAMTEFTDGGTRTPPPEELGLAGTLRALVLGVRIPRPQATSTPEEHGLASEHHRIDGPSGTLALTVIPGGPKVVVLVHGYANEHSQLLRTASVLHDAGYTVVAPDLRGVGGSDGACTTLGHGEAQDVDAVVHWVGEHLGDGEPVLYGFSMGAAAVVRAVGRLDTPACALVLESSFDRLHTTVGHRFESMGLPATTAHLLLFWGGVHTGVDPYDLAPVDDAPAIEVPVLVVAGTEDARVHPDDARNLASAFPDARLALIEGFPHAQLAAHRPDEWQLHVGAFLDALAHAPPRSTAHPAQP